MSLQTLKQIEVYENILTPTQFDTIMEQIKVNEGKFKTFQNNTYNYDRIFLHDHFTDSIIQQLISDILSKLGYNTNNLEVTITSYGTCQKYNWHNDDDSGRTNNYVLYLTDQKYFTGGELEVKINGETKKFIPKKNTLIVMDAKLEHRVLPVETKIGGIWQMSRLTLNGHIKGVND